MSKTREQRVRAMLVKLWGNGDRNHPAWDSTKGAIIYIALTLKIGHDRTGPIVCDEETVSWLESNMPPPKVKRPKLIMSCTATMTRLNQTDKLTGLIVHMSDGSDWFHPDNGSTPFTVKKATYHINEIED